ncbi:MULTISPECIES: DNA polymerase III subunit delta [Pseudidiomarina]|uniref:DNA polymerase III subunit delta n=2 Tax=Pseudidiomarina TaxID=2800384 RepID=A0A368VAA9_9GAMM|nr:MULTISPECIES: DNA polymerase III subunit delta [Pseudidiomarina]MDX1524756.1 DNA polymerase III subunit delta [Pseudidiomarina maritima]PWW16029.1 DNA polymerase III delta subunit [Pseudidiomarina maritima]RBP93461.1 DNA polymerase III delta subunit [Pseudidiomarina tainanensis]RCW35921.1 DNA polymerase III delta subunit [Pseudidiomarina tainanensis]
MQLYSSQLTQHLQQHGLAPIVCVFGDAPLLVDESVQQLRRFARQQGIDERQRLLQDAQLDWSILHTASANLSLFSTQRLLELELPEGKPGREGGEALRSYAEQPSQDQILVIIGPKLKQEQQKAKWFQQLSKVATMVSANNPERQQLPRFIQQRAQRYQLQLDPSAVQLLADWYEGNLLALDQELQKLALSELPPPVTAALITSHSEDQSRFNVFALQEAILAADLDQALHKLQRLFEGDVEPAILNWALQREWTLVFSLQQALAAGQSFSAAAKQQRLWRSQEPAYRQFVQRMDASAMQVAGQLLSRLEYAFKGDSGDHYPTLVTQLVALYCRPQQLQQLPL